MEIIRRTSNHNIKHPIIKVNPKFRRKSSRNRRPKCIQATIVVMANKKTQRKPKRHLIPIDMNDPALDGLPVLLHDKETGTPSFTKGDMAVPLLETNNTKKRKKKRRKHRKKSKKAKKTTTQLQEYLKSFSISE
jgi:hypothetical protein